MKDIGKMICKMVMEWKLGLILQNMKAITRMERNMGKGFMFGLMGLNSKEHGKTIKLMEQFPIAIIKGIYTWVDGRKYEGEWQNNSMHGRGIYTWKNGRKYEGEYMHDKKHGFGIYSWTDGRKYEGYWQNSKQNGMGKYMLPDGSCKVGVWEAGVREKWLDNVTEIERPADWVDFKLPNN